MSPQSKTLLSLGSVVKLGFSASTRRSEVNNGTKPFEMKGIYCITQKNFSNLQA